MRLHKVEPLTLLIWSLLRNSESSLLILSLITIMISDPLDVNVTLVRNIYPAYKIAFSEDDSIATLREYFQLSLCPLGHLPSSKLLDTLGVSNATLEMLNAKYILHFTRRSACFVQRRHSQLLVPLGRASHAASSGSWQRASRHPRECAPLEGQSPPLACTIL